MTQPGKTIGILMTGHAVPEVLEALGDYDAMFARLLDGHGFSFKSYDCEGGVIPASPDECDGWLITGSKHGVYEDHAWIPPLEAFIRDVYAAGVPLIGVCFGHQIIAQALGGKVVKYDGGWSIGHTSYEIEGETRSLNAWHQDQVVELPEGAEVIAAEEFGHAGDLTLAYNPDVDDSIAKWGDCLESFKACITGGGAARACSEQSSCPETCRTEYESSLGAASGLEEELEAFEAVYIVAGAPCRPSGDEATP